jgi:hypothetical protein
LADSRQGNYQPRLIERHGCRAPRQPPTGDDATQADQYMLARLVKIRSVADNADGSITDTTMPGLSAPRAMTAKRSAPGLPVPGCSRSTPAMESVTPMQPAVGLLRRAVEQHTGDVMARLVSAA